MKNDLDSLIYSDNESPLTIAKALSNDALGNKSGSNEMKEVQQTDKSKLDTRPPESERILETTPATNPLTEAEV